MSIQMQLQHYHSFLVYRTQLICVTTGEMYSAVTVMSLTLPNISGNTA